MNAPTYSRSQLRFFKQLDRNLKHLDDETEPEGDLVKELRGVLSGDESRRLSNIQINSRFSPLVRSSREPAAGYNALYSSVKIISIKDYFNNIKTLNKPSDMFESNDSINQFAAYQMPYDIFDAPQDINQYNQTDTKNLMERMLFSIYTLGHPKLKADLMAVFKYLQVSNMSVHINRTAQRIIISMQSTSQFDDDVDFPSEQIIFNFTKHVIDNLDLDDPQHQDVFLAIQNLHISRMVSTANLKQILLPNGVTKNSAMRLLTTSEPDEFCSNSSNLKKLILISMCTLDTAPSQPIRYELLQRLSNHRHFQTTVSQEIRDDETLILTRIDAFSKLHSDDDLAPITGMLQRAFKQFINNALWLDTMTAITDEDLQNVKLLRKLALEAIDYIHKNHNVLEATEFFNQHFSFSKTLNCITFHGLPITDVALPYARAISDLSDFIKAVTAFINRTVDFSVFPNYKDLTTGVNQLMTGAHSVTLGVMVTAYGTFDVSVSGTVDHATITLKHQVSHQTTTFDNQPNLTWDAIASQLYNMLQNAE